MNEAAALLQQALGALVLPTLLGIRAVRKKFALDPDKPTIHEGIIILAMAVVGFGLSYASWMVNPLPPNDLLSLWFVQGFLYFIALLLGDMGMDATSIKSASAERKIATIEANNMKDG